MQAVNPISLQICVEPSGKLAWVVASVPGLSGSAPPPNFEGCCPACWGNALELLTGHDVITPIT